MAKMKSSKKRNKKMDPNKILDKNQLRYPAYKPVKDNELLQRRNQKSPITFKIT